MIRHRSVISVECLRDEQLNLDLAFGSATDLRDLGILIRNERGESVTMEAMGMERTATGALLTLVPRDLGHFAIHIYCGGAELSSSPVELRVSAQMANSPVFDSPHVGHVSFSGLSEPCAIGSVVEVVINAQGGRAASDAVEVLSVSPSGEKRSCGVIHRANFFTAVFTPDEVGEWQIGILYDGEHIRGSPFSCQVFDADCVSVFGLDIGLVGQELKFVVDGSHAGQGQAKVVVFRDDEHQIPCGVIEETTRGRYRVRFTPDGSGQYKIHVTFNNVEVKGSPFVLEIADANAVSVRGDQLKMAAVNRNAHFFVDAVGAKTDDLDVIITDPYDLRQTANVETIADSAFRIEWRPTKIGEHLIEVRLYGESAFECPFVCNVGDPSLVVVRKMPNSIDPENLNSDLSFEIDATDAGSGNLEIVINGGRVTCRVRELATRQFEALFSPTEPIEHQIEMRFNGEHVRGSPWILPLNSGEHFSELVGLGLHRAQNGALSFFDINSSNRLAPLDPSDVSVRLTDSEGEHVKTHLIPTADGIRCEYSIPRVDDYRLEVYINGRLIDSGVLTVAGYDLEKVRVQTPKGSGVGNPIQFVGCPIRVDVNSKGIGKPVSAPVQSRVSQIGVAGVTTSPRPPSSAYFSETASPARVQSVAHTVAQYGDSPKRYFGDPVDTKPIAGDSTVDSGLGSYGTTSPKPHRFFEAEPPPLPTSPPPDPNRFEMTRSAEVRLFRDADGKTRPAAVRTQDLTTFASPPAESPDVVAEEGYDYRVTSDTPRAAEISPKPLGDRIPEAALQRTPDLRSTPLDDEVQKRKGDSLTPGTRRKLFEHSVQKSSDLRESSFEESDRVGSKSSSKTTTPRLSLKFGKDRRDPSRGFDFGKSKFTSKHEVIRLGKDVEVKLENIKLGKEDQLRIIVSPPSRSKTEDESLVVPHRLKRSGKTFEIGFRPTEVGTHKVLAFVNDEAHPLSPFPIRVYDSSQIIVGEIVAETVINDTVEFTVDAGRAGFGNLEMAIKDAGGVIIPSHVSQLEASTAKFLVTFNPTSIGIHTVNITFNKETIKGSPFEVNVTGGADMPEGTFRKRDKSKEKKRESKKEKNGIPKGKPAVTKIPSLSRVGRPAIVLLQIPNPADVVVATVSGMSEQNENTEKIIDSTKEIRAAEVFEEEPNIRRIEFVPLRVGDHEIIVTVNGEEIAGSPFTCRAYDPARIVLGKVPNGAVGKPVHFVVDAGDAGVGNLEVAVNDGKIPSMAHALGQHKYDISFVPREDMDHHISVRFNNEAVPGSPFVCRLRSAPRVSASGAGLERVPVGRSVDFGIHIEEPESAQPPLPNVMVVDSKGNHLPVAVSRDIRIAEPGHFVAEYTPKVVGNHSVEVSFDGEPILGSPFNVKAFDASCARLSLIETAIVGRPCTFIIDAAKAGAGNMEIIVSVENRNVPNFVQAEGQAKFKVSFTPQEPKEHIISVKFNGEPIPGSPLICPVETSGEPTATIRAPPLPQNPPPDDEELRLVGDLATATVGQPKRFSIDTSRPDVECNVLILDSKGNGIRSEITTVAEGFDVEFVPKTAGAHNIDIQVDGRSLSICPIVCNVVKLPTVPDVHLPIFPQRAQIDRSSRFEIEIPSGVDTEPLVDISDPDGNPMNAELKRVSEKRFVVEWTPKRSGIHSIAVRLGEVMVADSPHRIAVLDLSEVQLRGLRNDVVGVTQEFNVDWSRSGGGECRAAVRLDDGEVVSVKSKLLKAGLSSHSFVPHRPGLYQIDIFVDEYRLPECPYECVIADSKAVRARGAALHGAQCGRTARFEVVVGDTDRGDLDVMITDVNKYPLPVRCYKQQDESYSVEFTPETAGTHTVDITFADAPINGSPFQCEVVDPSKLTVRGLTDSLILRHAAQFSVSKQNAGNGTLEFEIRDPSGTLLKVDKLKNSADEDSFTFLPTKIGSHPISMRFGGFTVPNIPKSIKVEEVGQLTLSGTALERSVEPNTDVQLSIDTRHQVGGLKIDIRDPNDTKLHHSTERQSDNRTQIAFRPETVGVHSVSVDFNNKPLSGSPFKVTVVDPSKVLINDENATENGTFVFEKNKRNQIEIDTTAAGSEQLKAEIIDPRGDHLHDFVVENVDLHKHRLLVTPRRSGVHKIFLTFGDLPVPSANPVVVNVDSANRRESVEEERVRIYGDGIHKGMEKEAAEFFVDISGHPNAKISAAMTGEKAEIPIRLQQMSPHLYKAVYTPLIPGQYELNILVDGKPTNDSPFKVYIRSPNSPAECIDVDARTLKIGIIGEDVKTVIDARRAKAGHLSAQCEGPSQLEYCELFDNRDGTYILRVTPKETGKHILSIKYSDEHVPGSPFIFNVANPPDPSKVRVHGPGIEHGILANFKSNFVVETRGAGAGQLTVRVRGPKGAFNVEMQRDRQQDRTIHCKYEPKEPGDYQVEVKWHGEHVPGSPFLVIIVDTEHELQRFLSGQIPSPTPLTPFVPPGWMGSAPPPMGLMGPPMAPSPYGPVPAGMITPALRGRPQQPQIMYGTSSHKHF